MSLASDYENYVDNGGEIAIHGFNFQTYVGIYLMLHLHKLKNLFEISFEKDDDISLINLTSNKKFKIQVKSEKLTLSKVINGTKKDPKSILGKLLLNSENYNYVVLTFGQERGSALKELCKKEDKNLGNFCYSLDCKNFEDSQNKFSKNSKDNFKKIKKFLDESKYPVEKLLFQETPFTTESDNCLNYLFGYSNNDYQGTLRKIEINKNQLLCILGSIYHSIDRSSQITKFDNNIFKIIEKQNKKEEYIEGLLRELEFKRGFTLTQKLKNNKADYIENKELYRNLLGDISIPKISDNQLFADFLYDTAQEIEKNLTENKKERINIYIIKWYIIDKYIDREFLYDGYQN